MRTVPNWFTVLDLGIADLNSLSVGKSRIGNGFLMGMLKAPDYIHLSRIPIEDRTPNWE